MKESKVAIADNKIMLFSQYDPNSKYPYGQRHPDAPPELALFDFMIGEFTCHDRVLLANGTWREMEAIWQTNYTLNGHAIQDNYRNEMYAGMSIRVYSLQESAWHVTFFGMPGGHTGLWKGGEEGSKIVLQSLQQAPDGTAVISRLSFSEISKNGFEWLGERIAEDGSVTPTWQISARRRE